MVEYIYVSLKVIELIFLTIRYRIEAQISPPNGIKINECVNCLWNSKNSKGSSEDRIKISKSGAKPDNNPIKATTNKECFFLEITWEAVEPIMP